MKTIRRRPGKKTPAGQIAARDDEIRHLHRELDKTEKANQVLVGLYQMWRSRDLRERSLHDRTEQARQKLVGKVADLEAENRELRRRLDGQPARPVEDQPTIPTPLPVLAAVSPVVRVGGPGGAPFVATDPGCVKPTAWAVRGTGEAITWGVIERADKPEPQPASEADTQRLPAADSQRTGETAVASGVAG